MLQIPTYSEAFAADGTTGGIIQVVDSKKFWPGSRGAVSATGLGGKEVVVLELIDATHIRVKEWLGFGEKAPANYVGCNLSAYTVALAATITIPQQTVFYGSRGGAVDRIPTIL